MSDLDADICPDPRRRGVLRAGGVLVALALARPALADANELQAAIATYTGGREAIPGRVTIDVARLVDNGNAVPVTVRVESPMSAADHVRAIALFNERNPERDVARFALSRALRSRRRVDAHPARDVAAARRDRDDERRQPLVGRGRRRGHARRVHRGRGVMARTLITVPQDAKRGDVVEIRVLIAHPMETGFRAGSDGKRVPRDILRRFTCRLDGDVVFAAELFPAIAANPYLAFALRVERGGTLSFTWEGDGGFAQTETAALKRRMRRALASLALVVLVVGFGAGAEGPAALRLRRHVVRDAGDAADDTQNPAMLFVADGEALWRRQPAPAAKSCAACHGDARTSMRGVAARYPAFDAPLARPVNLGERINLCRARQQKAAAVARREPATCWRWRPTSHCSRAARPSRRPTTRASRRSARAASNATGSASASSTSRARNATTTTPARRLGGSTIPQGHPTGYPIYRLEWQALGSLQRRLRGCYAGVRAEAPPYGALELVELELYLASRAAGMRVDSPAVRP